MPSIHRLWVKFSIVKSSKFMCIYFECQIFYLLNDLFRQCVTCLCLCLNNSKYLLIYYNNSDITLEPERGVNSGGGGNSKARVIFRHLFCSKKRFFRVRACKLFKMIK